MLPAPGGRFSGGHLSGSDRCAAPLSRTKDHPRLPRHRQMCRFVRVAEGFRAENAFSCHDTDRVGKWSVSRQAGGKQAFVGCLSRRRLSPKCARRTGHRQRGIRFLLRALALERPVCAAILRYTASGRSFVRALWRETQINGQNGGKHRSAEKSGDGYGRADYCFDTTTT